MAHITADRVKESTTSTGTGSLTLAGADTGYRTFGSVMVDGDTCHYTIAHRTANEWESGVGKWTTGGVFVRLFVDSSSTGSLINFSAGTKDIFLSYIASRNKQPVRIAFVTDSVGAQNLIGPTSWPQYVLTKLNLLGGAVVGCNFGLNGGTFHKMHANNYFPGVTIKQAVVNYKPDVIIVSLGHNDTVFKENVENRTYAQIIDDAGSLFTYFKTNLPATKIYYSSQMTYDNVNFTTPQTTLKNKGVMPARMTLRSNGSIIDASFCSEILDDQLSSSVKTQFGEWINLDSFIKTTVTANGECDGYWGVNGWRIARLGLTQPDGLHFNDFGHSMAAAYIMWGLSAQTSFTNVCTFSTQNDYSADTSKWNEPDALFLDHLKSSGDGWIRTSNTVWAGQDMAYYSKYYAPLSTESWYLPYKTRWAWINNGGLAENTLSLKGVTGWEIHNGPPNRFVELSVNGGGWSNTTTPLDEYGRICAYPQSVYGSFPPGTYTIRYRTLINDADGKYEVYGPQTLTLSPANTAYVHSIVMNPGSIQQARGTTVASNGTMEFSSSSGNFFHVTGTSAINLISNTGWQGGSMITLCFEAAASLVPFQSTVGTNVGLILSEGSTYTAVATEMITLIYDDAYLAWMEVSRTANAANKIIGPKSITIEAPSASENVTMFLCDQAWTLSSIRSVVRGTTPSVTFTIKYATSRSVVGTEVITGGVTCTGTGVGQVNTSFNNGTIPANNWVWISTTATSGTVTDINVTLN